MNNPRPSRNFKAKSSFHGKPAFSAKPTFNSKPPFKSVVPFKKVEAVEKHGPSPIPKKAPGEFPMRINKYLAWKGFATRRAADDLVAKHQVMINGRYAVLGDQVVATDEVNMRKSGKPEDRVYYAYFKPRGISTEGDRKGTPSIASSIALRGVFAVGSLDVNAEGLIILSNDRRIVDRLLNPAHAHQSEYYIRTVGPVRANFKEKMESGIVIGNAKPIACQIKLLGQDAFALRIAGGESHIRQMCSMFFAEVNMMQRTSILNI